MVDSKRRPNDEYGFSTQAIHHGYDPQNEHGALCPPIHLSSTFTTADAATLSARYSGDAEGFIYSRVANPTVDLLERRIATLEGAEAALGNASGMGSISSAFWTLLKAGDEVLADKTLYGCTFAFLNQGLTRFGVTVRHVDMTNLDAVAEAISSKTRIIYFETPTNPNLRIIDIASIASLAKQSDATLIVDNTFATPFITKPIHYGADLVVHSATKYLGGHGDLIAGFVAGSAEIIEKIRLEGLKDLTGAAMSPFTAMLLLRGLKTLQLRMERHCKSADTIARWIFNHPVIERVYYPGLENDDGYNLARHQMSLFGGMVAFELKDGKKAGFDLIDKLDLIQCAVSLGDAETLIQHPASMTHSTYTEEEREHHGISDGLIRLSVGLEASEDLIADLDKALC